MTTNAFYKLPTDGNIDVLDALMCSLASLSLSFFFYFSWQEVAGRKDPVAIVSEMEACSE